MEERTLKGKLANFNMNKTSKKSQWISRESKWQKKICQTILGRPTSNYFWKVL